MGNDMPPGWQRFPVATEVDAVFKYLFAKLSRRAGNDEDWH